MGFSARQISALRRNVDHRRVRWREINGRELSYLEGWYAISAANRIFGFDGWSRETLDAKCVLSRENRGAFLAVYTAKVRITVTSNGSQIIREGHGTGEGRGSSPGEAHDTSLKAAETDATKRALITFGKPFGLELYRSDPASGAKTNPREQSAYLPQERAPPLAELDARRLENARPHPDDGTPIPRPSTHYGLEPYLESREERGALVRDAAREARQRELSEAPPAVNRSTLARSSRIDKSALPFPEPKRLRDKNHLKFVASQPCVICGRQPSDPHHLRFAQPRAIGMKVSDEFTVPLCRSHHRNLHQAGNELAWWSSFKIEPLPIARKLWEETHPSIAPARHQPEMRPATQPTNVRSGSETEPNPNR